MKNAFQRVKKKKLDQKNVKLEAVARTCEKLIIRRERKAKILKKINL